MSRSLKRRLPVLFEPAAAVFVLQSPFVCSGAGFGWFSARSCLQGMDHKVRGPLNGNGPIPCLAAGVGHLEDKLT